MRFDGAHSEQLQCEALQPSAAATEQILVHGIRRRESGSHC
jgi:hypothetical protein